MIALYLIAAHLTGDFLLQTRWQAVGKFGWTAKACDLRTRHVLAYSLPFMPVAAAYAHGPAELAAFMLLLYALHWLTDSRRFTSTLGDVLAWHGVVGPGDEERMAVVRDPDTSDEDLRDVMRLEPNPWAPLPILIDQSLHVVQVAVLAGLFL